MFGWDQMGMTWLLRNKWLRAQASPHNGRLLPVHHTPHEFGRIIEISGRHCLSAKRFRSDPCSRPTAYQAHQSRPKKFGQSWDRGLITVLHRDTVRPGTVNEGRAKVRGRTEKAPPPRPWANGARDSATSDGPWPNYKSFFFRIFFIKTMDISYFASLL